MYVNITETRYGNAQLAALVELNTAIILIIISLVAGVTAGILVAFLPLVCGVICLFEGSTIIDRGVSYRIKDRLIGAGEWTLGDLDDMEYNEMRETGSVEVEVP